MLSQTSITKLQNRHYVKSVILWENNKEPNLLQVAVDKPKSIWSSCTWMYSGKYFLAFIDRLGPLKSQVMLWRSTWQLRRIDIEQKGRTSLLLTQQMMSPKQSSHVDERTQSIYHCVRFADFPGGQDKFLVTQVNCLRLECA